mmetsp:Transcript_23253/g.66708  ORF Transcript_23253/g.66708 Transcript_23253/m.66708 type:complete len:146 (+) Transcript_23253:1-438(+)
MIEVAHAMLRLQQPEAATTAVTQATVATEKPPATPEKVKLSTPVADPAGAAAPAPVAAPAPEAAPAPMVSPEIVKVPAAAQGMALRGRLLALLRDEAADAAEGLVVSDLCSKVGASEAEVRSCLGGLVDEGEVFATIDDDHYACV